MPKLIRRKKDANLSDKSKLVLTPDKSTKAHISLGASDALCPELTIRDNASLTPDKYASPDKFEECLRDCKSLTAMGLRKKYQGVETCHKRMLRREVEGIAKVDPRFRDFRDYLAYVGPKPFPEATVDRIHNPDPEYAPGKVQWADKATQNNNRSCSKRYTAPDGTVYTRKQLAEKHGITPQAIVMREKAGWTNVENVANKKGVPTSPSPAPTPIEKPSIISAWEQAIKDTYPDMLCVVSGRDVGILTSIAETLREVPAEHIEAMIACIIENWDDYATDAKTNAGETPWDYETGAMKQYPEIPNAAFVMKHVQTAINYYLKDNSIPVVKGVPLWNKVIESLQFTAEEDVPTSSPVKKDTL